MEVKHSVRVIAINKDGKFLCFSHKKSKLLGFPGGKVESEIGESAKEAAIRELKEEVGIQVSNASDIEELDSVLDIRKKHLYTIFHLKPEVLNNQIPSNLEPEKHEDFGWLSLRDIEEKKLLNGTRVALNYCGDLVNECNCFVEL